MKLIKNYILLVCILTLSTCSNAQLNKNNQIVQLNVNIAKFKFDFPIIKGESSLKPVGYFNDSIIYAYENYNTTNLSFFILNENSFTFRPIFNNMVVDPKSSFFYSFKDSSLFYRVTHYSDKNDGYNTLILQNGNKKIWLDSIYNADKKIQANFSIGSRILLVNTLNTLSDFYNPSQDNRLACYYLDSIINNKIERIYIPCFHCSDAYLINNKLFFNKSNIYDDLTNGFEWKDLYMATWPDMKDTVKIASFTKIVSISPDGKYILAIRQFDLPNDPCAIIDVESKKYQLLLDRDYAKADAIYSINKKQFAFDFHDGKIIYIDIPSEFPFDALLKKNPKIPDWPNKTIQ